MSMPRCTYSRYICWENCLTRWWHFIYISFLFAHTLRLSVVFFFSPMMMMMEGSMVVWFPTMSYIIHTNDSPVLYPQRFCDKWIDTACSNSPPADSYSRSDRHEIQQFQLSHTASLIACSLAFIFRIDGDSISMRCVCEEWCVRPLCGCRSVGRFIFVGDD